MEMSDLSVKSQLISIGGKMMNEENLRLTSTTADTVSSKNPGWILKVVPNMR